MAEETVPTSAAPATTLQVNMPTELVLRHQTDKWSEAVAQQQASDSKVAKSAWLLKKLENEQRIKELEPKILEKQQIRLAARRLIEEGARELIGDMKVSDVFADVKKELRKLKIHSIVCSIDMQPVDDTNIEMGIVQFTRHIGEDKRGYGSTMSGTDQVKFTPEMKDHRKQWLALGEEIKAMEAELMKAKVSLEDRANQMADIEGIIALKSLTQEEAEKTKAVYENMKQGTTVAGLLGGKA